MTNQQTDDAFEALHDAQRQAQFLYMDLRDAGDDAGAASAKLRVDRLQNEIDNLINRELDEWKAGAETLIPQLSQMAAAAQDAVNDVEKDVQNAQKVGAALAQLDTLISTAVKFIA
jgi:hypothetical protein